MCPIGGGCSALLATQRYLNKSTHREGVASHSPYGILPAWLISALDRVGFVSI